MLMSNEAHITPQSQRSVLISIQLPGKYQEEAFIYTEENADRKSMHRFFFSIMKQDAQLQF